jgi:hypothetical protein
MQSSLIFVLSFHYSSVIDKNSPSPPEIEGDEESSNSHSSRSIDTIDSDMDSNDDLNNDIALMSNNLGDDNVSDDKKHSEINNNVIISNNYDDGVTAATKMYELEPTIVHVTARDCSFIPLGDDVYVHEKFTSIENYQFCFKISADKFNVYLKIGHFYPDRGIFVYCAYTEADSLSSLRLVFITANLDKYSSISWKYFLTKKYPSASHEVKMEVNIYFASCKFINLTV